MVLSEKVKKRDSDRFSILSELQIFNDWSRTRLSGLSKHTFELTISKGECILTKGMPCSNVYILLEGEAMIVNTYSKRLTNISTIGSFLKNYIPTTEERPILRIEIGKSVGEEAGFSRAASNAPFTIRVASTTARFICIPKAIIIANAINKENLEYINQVGLDRLKYLEKTALYFKSIQKMTNKFNSVEAPNLFQQNEMRPQIRSSTLVDDEMGEEQDRQTSKFSRLKQFRIQERGRSARVLKEKNVALVIGSFSQSNAIETAFTTSMLSKKIEFRRKRQQSNLLRLTEKKQKKHVPQAAKINVLDFSLKRLKMIDTLFNTPIQTSKKRALSLRSIAYTPSVHRLG